VVRMCGNALVKKRFTQQAGHHSTLDLSRDSWGCRDASAQADDCASARYADSADSGRPRGAGEASQCCGQRKFPNA
jgi:hypothetical protein